MARSTKSFRPDNKQTATAHNPGSAGGTDRPWFSDEVALCGPAMLGLASTILLMVYLWRITGPRPPLLEEFGQLTSEGLAHFLPDYDIPIYVLGIALGGALFALAYGSWRRRLARAIDPTDRDFVRGLAVLHYPLAVGLLFSLSTSPPASWQYLSAAVAGPAFSALAWVATPAELLRIHAQLRARRRWAALAIGCLAPLLVIGLIFIPNCAEFSTRVFLGDGYHHWDFYAMTPALALRHGRALCVDTYTQYGVGWPMIFAALSLVVPLSYKLLLQVATLVVCGYFCGLFAFLRWLQKELFWPAIGLTLALHLQMFSGTDGKNGPMFATPSSTALRHPLDLLVFSFCLFHLRRRQAGLRVASGYWIGGLTGLEMLFSTETGLYLLVALALYALIGARMPVTAAAPTARPANWWLFAGQMAVGFAAVLLAGLAIAGHGAIFSPALWLGWTEAARAYSGGLSSLPIRSALLDPTSYQFIVCVLTIYGLVLGRALQQAWARTISPSDVVLGMVSLYGLEVLLLFINRSHIWNFHHALIPFAIVASSLAARLHAALRKGLPRRLSPGVRIAARAGLAIFPAVVLAFLLVRLLTNPNVRDYPSLLSDWSGARRWRTPADDDEFLFESRRDAPLSASKNSQQLATFRELTGWLKRLKQENRSVAMLANNDTPCLVEADLPPYFRYTPVLRILRLENLHDVVQTLHDHPPDYVLMCIPEVGLPEQPDVTQIVKQLVADYTRDSITPVVTVYRRNDAAALRASAL